MVKPSVTWHRVALTMQRAFFRKHLTRFLHYSLSRLGVQKMSACLATVGVLVTGLIFCVVFYFIAILQIV